MDKVYDKCCGIDLHKKLIVACFKQGNRQEIRDFGATTRELLEMADWLKEGGCEMVAMESTASYWKPLYNILETCELKAMVVNAQHMKAVPGRKTDVKDAEWILNARRSEKIENLAAELNVSVRTIKYDMLISSAMKKDRTAKCRSWRKRPKSCVRSTPCFWTGRRPPALRPL